VAKDATPGFILSRALEINGRPIAFAFTSTPPEPDGAEVFLRTSLLKRSLNYRSLAAGQAYRCSTTPCSPTSARSSHT
jgi:hypothetical protein